MELNRRQFLLLILLCSFLLGTGTILKFFQWTNEDKDLTKIYEKIIQWLTENDFKYKPDEVHINTVKRILEKLFPDINFKVNNYSLSNIEFTLELDEKFVKKYDIDPKAIKTFIALVNLGEELLSGVGESFIVNGQYFKYLRGDVDIPITISVPTIDLPSDVEKPTKLLETKEGDCEDYAIFLYYLLSLYGPSIGRPFVIIVPGHAMVGYSFIDIPNNEFLFKLALQLGAVKILGSTFFLKQGFTLKQIEKILDITTNEVLNCDRITIITEKQIFSFKNSKNELPPEVQELKNTWPKLVKFLKEHGISIDENELIKAIKEYIKLRGIILTKYENIRQIYEQKFIETIQKYITDKKMFEAFKKEMLKHREEIILY